MASIKTIRQLLETELSPTALVIEDESHLHSGHYHQESTDPSHLRVVIVSPKFEGLSKVKQHQLVNRVLKVAFDEGLHALALETKAV